MPEQETNHEVAEVAEQAPEPTYAEMEESAIEEVVDWVEHEVALAMFEANKCIAWIKTKMHDGIVRMLGRNGDTQ